VTEDPAFVTLDDAQLAFLDSLGERRPVVVGEYLIREGDLTYDFFALVSAEVDIILTVDGRESLMAHHGPGRFLGELSLLSGLRAFLSAKVTDPEKLSSCHANGCVR